MNGTANPTLRLGQHRLPSPADLRTDFDAILERRWYANGGPLVHELEQRFARFTGAREAIAVANGTLAVALAVRALEPKGPVALPARASLAAVQGAFWGGAEIDLLDIEEPSLAPRSELLSGHHGAVLCLPGAESPEVPTALREAALALDLPLIVEASETVGATRDGARLPFQGLVQVHDFGFEHLIGAGEGAVLTTNDERLAARVRFLRSFHGNADGMPRLPRVNAKMAEAPAALILRGLNEIEDRIAANTELFEAYREALASLPGVDLRRAPSPWLRTTRTSRSASSGDALPNAPAVRSLTWPRPESRQRVPSRRTSSGERPAMPRHSRRTHRSPAISAPAPCDSPSAPE